MNYASHKKLGIEAYKELLRTMTSAELAQERKYVEIWVGQAIGHMKEGLRSSIDAPDRVLMANESWEDANAKLIALFDEEHKRKVAQFQIDYEKMEEAVEEYTAATQNSLLDLITAFTRGATETTWETVPAGSVVADAGVRGAVVVNLDDLTVQTSGNETVNSLPTGQFHEGAQVLYDNTIAVNEVLKHLTVRTFYLPAYLHVKRGDKGVMLCTFQVKRLVPQVVPLGIELAGTYAADAFTGKGFISTFPIVWANNRFLSLLLDTLNDVYSFTLEVGWEAIDTCYAAFRFGGVYGYDPAAPPAYNASVIEFVHVSMHVIKGS